MIAPTARIQAHLLTQTLIYRSYMVCTHDCMPSQHAGGDRGFEMTLGACHVICPLHTCLSSVNTYVHRSCEDTVLINTAVYKPSCACTQCPFTQLQGTRSETTHACIHNPPGVQKHTHMCISLFFHTLRHTPSHMYAQSHTTYVQLVPSFTQSQAPRLQHPDPI